MIRNKMFSSRLHILELPATEKKEYFGFIFLFQKLANIPQLELKIVFLGLRSNFDFLDLDDRSAFSWLHGLSWSAGTDTCRNP